MPGKNALVGRNALHLLPGVVDNVHFRRRNAVIFGNFRFGELRHRDDALGPFGNAAVLQAVPCSAQPPAGVGVKVRACAVADIVHNGNAAEAEQRDDIAGGKSPGPALPEVARVVELLPDAAPVRAEGNDLYIGIVWRFNARRGDNFDKARRDDAVQRGEQLDGIALDARKALGKKRAVNGPDGVGHKVPLLLRRGWRRPEDRPPYDANCCLYSRILLTLRSKRSSEIVPFCTASRTAA